MTLREAARKKFKSMPECNFNIERNGKIIGKTIGMPAKNENHLYLGPSNPSIENGDTLINGFNEKFAVIKIETVDKNFFRLYFKRLPNQEQP